MSEEAFDPVAYIQRKAEQLVFEAVARGVSLEIRRESIKPLAMGNVKHVVDAWPAREGPKP